MFPKSMPHLVGALKMEASPGQKLCVHCAAGFVLDTPGATFACATFSPATPEQAALIPNASNVPFIHAWAEYRDDVWSPTAIDQMGGQLRPMNREGYYRVNGATDVKLLTRRQLLKVAKEIGLSRHLRLGVPAKASVGSSILTAAGKAHRSGPDGALLPPVETANG